MKVKSQNSATVRCSKSKMIISGLESVTLIDYPGEVACTIFLKGCNYRCQYCHNPELIFGKDIEEIPKEDILSYLKRKKGKIDAVCITGGEPLISLDIDFLRDIKNEGYKIKIDTNGSFPGKLKEIIEGGLVDYVAMDIKSSPGKYSEIISQGFVLSDIEESIKLVSNLENYEFRTTCSERFHDEGEIRRIGEWVTSLIGKKADRYYLQGFKNSGNFINKDLQKDRDFPEEKLLDLKKVAEPFFEFVEIRV